MRPRIIPVLLLDEDGLVKTIQFKEKTYIGDPINAIRLFNDMEVDELIVLDISASKKGKKPNLVLINEMASEAFMPVTYGGGITSAAEAREILALGIEKISINLGALDNLELVKECSAAFGASTVIGALDIKKPILGVKNIYNHKTKKILKIGIGKHLNNLLDANVGEIFINSVDCDGVMKGYDLELIKEISPYIKVPLICCGGAGSLEDMKKAADIGVNGIAAGSIFVYQGKTKGVLINYPTQEKLNSIFGRF